MINKMYALNPLVKPQIKLLDVHVGSINRMANRKFGEGTTWRLTKKLVCDLYLCVKHRWVYIYMLFHETWCSRSVRRHMSHNYLLMSL